MKTCTKCKEPKDRDAFHRDSSRSDGLTAQCKTCRAAKAAERQRTEETRSLEAARHRARRATNGDTIRAKDRAYMAGYRAANGDKLRQYHRDRYATDSGPKLEAKARRKAAKVGSSIGGPISYKILRTRFPDCYLCGQTLSGRVQYDHVIPLQPRPGEPQGAHTTDNLRPTHERCNLRKSNARLADLDWYSGPTDIGVPVP